MELLFVHLTDIHVQDDNDLDVLLTRTDSLAGAICKHITEPENTTVFMCVTGDFAFSGQENQYTVAGRFLEEINSIISGRFPRVSINPIFVPGNHDCDFKSDCATMRETLLASPLLNVTDSAQLKICTSIQKCFFDFAKEWEVKYKAMSCADDKVLTVNEFNNAEENMHLKFHCLNTSWCSKRNEEKGKMKMVFDQLPTKDRNDIVITLMHHDAEWLDWDDKEVWNEYHRKFSDIIFVGHDHAADFIWKQNYDKTSNYYIKGNQLYDKKNADQSGFNILKLNTDVHPMQECFFTYEWDGELYKKIIDTDYHPFIRNRFVKTSIELKEEVWGFLENLDIDLFNKKNKREIKLSDIFGFPTLREEKKKTSRFFRNMKELMEYLKENPFVSIRGQKEYGKTALLKQLFKEFFLQKKFPVFLEPTQINSADGEVLNKLITEKYAQTYENISAEEIMQKAPNELICIIDNFEEIMLSDKSIKKFLKYLTSKFGNVILSRNPKLELINPLSNVETNDFINDNFTFLGIQEARKSYGERIINKWLLLDDENGDINSPDFDARRRKKYEQISNVMRGNFFNKTPVDLLLVLSYLEQDEPTQIDYSRYSFIYDNLILQRLNAIGNKETKIITKYKTILQCIAYKMFQDDITGSVKDSYIISIILTYKDKHSGFNMDVADLLKRLVSYRFLEQKNDNYRFKCGYMYYYFAGSYITQKLPPEMRREVIKDVFLNINKDLNYNIALFLAYSLSIEFEILPVIKNLEDELLANYSDFKYEKIRDVIEKWSGNIEEKAERIYTVPENENIPVLREKRLQEQEEKEQNKEEQEDKDEYKVAQNATDEDVKKTNDDVIKIGRLLEFSGNILKNYSGSMEDTQREEAIDVMFKSVTKVLGSFCSYSLYAVDKLIEMLEEKIKDGDEEAIEAKSDFIAIIKYLMSQIWLQFVGDSVSALTYGLDSDDLKENIDSYCYENKSDLTKMIRVEYLIRIANTRLPIEEIKKLYEGKECLDDISKKILRKNIFKYLSSYQFDPRDKQAICNLLKFDIKNVLLNERKLIIANEK